jgi:dihydrodipicolinate synthase/N-acetylneuraminate lyase
LNVDWRAKLNRGVVIPAHPLAVTAERKLDERRQRALTRYYLDAGAGGIAVAVHTTQFEIRDPRIGLFEPVLALAADEMRGRDVIRIAGVCGGTRQAVAEAETAARLGYHAGLLSMAALPSATVPELIQNARAVGEVIPLIGFYLQPAVGGRVLPEEFWAEFAALDCVAGIKIAPFDRYKTMDVIRGVAKSGRAANIALYTGNDDHIIVDLLTTIRVDGQQLRIVGGLLGHWAVWTRRVVETFQQIQTLKGTPIPPEWLTLAAEITDANAALFDVANQFHGCIPGIHEILRRQGLLAGTWCLNPDEVLSPGQAEELDRVCSQYPHLTDDEFVRENLDAWLKP